jgi:hypothetical protein
MKGYGCAYALVVTNNYKKIVPTALDQVWCRIVCMLISERGFFAAATYSADTAENLITGSPQQSKAQMH